MLKDNYIIKTADTNTSQNSGSGGFLSNFSTSGHKMMAVGSLVGLGLLINKTVKNIKNDNTRKRLLAELQTSDPVLSQVDPDQLLEWYATIYHFAPNFSLDKAAVREVLQNFARFGRVDVNTLKMLADTEKSSQQAADVGHSWGDMLSGLAKTITLGS